MDEQLTIDGNDIVVPGACLAPDLGVLLAGSDVRGGPSIVPGVSGGLANPRRVNVTVVNLPLIIQGLVAFDGVTAHPDVRTGLFRNIAWLQQNILAPVLASPYTRTAVLTWHAETPLSKPVQPLSPLSTAADGHDQLRAVLRLEFPEGLFELA